MFENLDLALSLKRLATAFIPLVFGIIMHEVAHGYIALKLGDPTAKNAGRLTLNPLPHVDKMGLFAFVLTSLSSPFVFGWAKPVPVNFHYMKNPHKAMMLISAAGPLTNFAVAIFFALILKAFIVLFPISQWQGHIVWNFFISMLPLGITINCSLAWINLMPIPPLDGSKILAGILPRSLFVPYMNLERYGFMILILLLITGILGQVLRPLVSMSVNFIAILTGLK